MKKNEKISANITNYFLSEETIEELSNLITNSFDLNNTMEKLKQVKNTLYFKTMFSEDNNYKYIINPLNNHAAQVSIDFPERILNAFNDEEYLIGFIKQMAALHQVEIDSDDHQIIRDLNFFRKEDCYGLNDIFKKFKTFVNDFDDDDFPF